MSLVNQMLRDLEARQAPERGGEAVLQNLSVGVAQSTHVVSRVWFFFLAMVLVGLAVVGGWYLLQQRESPLPEPVEPMSKAVASPSEPIKITPISPQKSVEAPSEKPRPVSETAKPPVVESVSSAKPVKPAEPIEQPVVQKSTAPVTADPPQRDESRLAGKSPTAPQPAPVKKTEATAASVSAPPPAVERVDRPRSAEELAHAAYLRGSDSIARGRLQEAAAELEKAISLHPGHLQAREVWVAVLLRRGETERADEVLREGLKRQPKAYSLARLRARLLAEKGRTSEALRLLENTVPPVQADPEFYGLLAALYQRSEQHARAAAAYQRVLSVMPDKAVWWAGLGISLEKTQRLGEALQAYRRAQVASGLNAQVGAYVQNRITVLSVTEQ